MSSGITLSSATRQNLLSLQGTADLLATTQSRLSTGKKVNSALDNPANFFTSQALNSRSTDLSGLLDGISNGIQTIQAANQGITNLQKLTDQLKSTAQQAQASSNAFTTKASVASAINITTNPTTSSILGGTLTAATATGTTTFTTASLGNGTAGTASTSTGTTDVASNAALQALSGAINLDDGNGNTATYTINGSSTLAALTTALSTNGFSANFVADKLVITRSDARAFTATGAGATATGNGNATAGTSASGGDQLTLTVGGTAVNFTKLASGGSTAAGTYTDLASLVTAINGSAVGAASATAGKITARADNGRLVVTSGDTTTAFTATGAAANKLTIPTGSQTAQTTGGLAGKALTVSVGGAPATTINFGAGAVQTLDQLNAQLSTANAQASISSTGTLTITTTNEAGAETLQLGGSATTGLGSLFTNTAVIDPTLGGDGQANRNKLVTDYNNLLTQIDQMAKDASFNGVNLLNGDNLKIIFNEKSSSSLVVQGNAISSAGLGLSAIDNTNFKDGISISAVKDKVAKAVETLKGQASTYGSNLSVVQNRQDFTKGLVNILDTGSANLTNADLNEEAANSQALSTRNSLGISALSLANQAQQGVLQLLR